MTDTPFFWWALAVAAIGLAAVLAPDHPAPRAVDSEPVPGTPAPGAMN